MMCQNANFKKSNANTKIKIYVRQGKKKIKKGKGDTRKKQGRKNQKKKTGEKKNPCSQLDDGGKRQASEYGEGVEPEPPADGPVTVGRKWPIRCSEKRGG